MTTKTKSTAKAVQSVLPATMNEGELIALINDVVSQARQGEGNMHKAAYQALAYAFKTNNTNMLTRLVNELPNSARADAVMAWGKAFAPINFHQAKDKEGNKLFTADQRPMLTVKLRKDRTEKDWNLAAAFATPFYQYRKPNVSKEVSFNVVDTLRHFIARLDKAINKAAGTPKAEELKAQHRIAMAAMAAAQ